MINQKQKEQRIGEKNVLFNGLTAEIVEYRSSIDIDLLLSNGEIRRNMKYTEFLRGKVKSYFLPSVRSVGYIGEIGTILGNEKAYETWSGMLKRCYTPCHDRDMMAYKDSEVCEEWHNFTNFLKWYNSNFYSLDKEMMNLDKDIIIKGNKTYSPETCIFAPQRINKLFLTEKNIRGGCVLGVHKIKKNNNGDILYRSMISCNDGISERTTIHCGCFETEIESFNAYKKTKESYIKQVADEYKSKYPNFPQKLYDAMYSYEVEITD